MDSTTPTPMFPDFNPRAAWIAAALRSELHWQETRRVREAARLAALLTPDADAERPTVIPELL